MAQLVGTLAQACHHICKELEGHTMTVLGWDMRMGTRLPGAVVTFDLTVCAVMFRVPGRMEVSFFSYDFSWNSCQRKALQTDGIEVKKTPCDFPM
jgi:hypothetical protein